jgi:hypothetical protein
MNLMMNWPNREEHIDREENNRPRNLFIGRTDVKLEQPPSQKAGQRATETASFPPSRPFSSRPRGVINLVVAEKR